MNTVFDRTCTALKDAAVQAAPSTYYPHTKPSTLFAARQMRDNKLEQGSLILILYYPSKKLLYTNYA